MGISFGSKSVKPYVGSKEVTEAYVGSQLVYRAGLPYYYYFLGAETTYYISDNCQLAYYASVTKPAWATTYKIAIGASTGTTSPRIQLINVSEFIGSLPIAMGVCVLISMLTLWVAVERLPMRMGTMQNKR